MAAARSTEAVSTALMAAIDAGDVEAALELWDEDAVLIARDGTETRGRRAIAAVLRSLIANGARLAIELSTIYETATTAVVTGSLTMSVADGAGGEPFVQRSESLVVYSRGEDGEWRVAIDFPWGVPDR
jgi:uncharacterized protein (TIGR02246 family)